MNGGSNNVIDIDYILYIMCSLFDSVTLWGCALIRSTKHQSNIKHNNVTRFAMKKCTKWRKTRMYDVDTHCDVLHSCTDEVISSIFIPQITDHKNPSVLRARGLRNHDWWVFELLRNLFGHMFPDISACKSITLQAWTIVKKQCLHILKKPSQPSHFKESGWIKSINAHQCTCSYAIIWMYHLHYHVVDWIGLLHCEPSVMIDHQMAWRNLFRSLAEHCVTRI